MSEGGAGFPFGDFDPSQFLRFLTGAGGLPAAGQVTSQVARWVALESEGGTDPPVAPDTVRQFAELVRAAQVHVSAATPLAADVTADARVLSRAAWVDVAVPALDPVLTALAATLQRADADALGDMSGAGDEEGNPFGGFLEAMSPLLLGVQSGFMIGYLAQHLHAQHDLALPMANDPGIVVLATNVDRFEQEWDLPRDELRFYLAIHEVVHTAVHAVPWVSRRLVDLTLDYVGSLAVDHGAIEEQLAGFDPAHPESLQEVLDDPALLLGAFDSPARRQALSHLQRFTIVLEGYCDEVLARVGQPLIPSFARIREARQRHRVERGDAQRFIERLLGMEMEREHYERGAAFCNGVVERAGPDALNRLWERDSMLPTESELDAPGLWLARLEVMDQPGG
jgi:putative hydrolase